LQTIGQFNRYPYCLLHVFALLGMAPAAAVRESCTSAAASANGVSSLLFDFDQASWHLSRFLDGSIGPCLLLTLFISPWPWEVHCSMLYSPLWQLDPVMSFSPWSVDLFYTRRKGKLEIGSVYLLPRPDQRAAAAFNNSKSALHSVQPPIMALAPRYVHTCARSAGKGQLT
jgi:hypothetical protein